MLNRSSMYSKQNDFLSAALRKFVVVAGSSFTWAPQDVLILRLTGASLLLSAAVEHCLKVGPSYPGLTHAVVTNSEIQMLLVGPE